MRRFATAATIGLLGPLPLCSPATTGASLPRSPGVTVNIMSNAATCAYFCVSPVRPLSPSPDPSRSRRQTTSPRASRR